MLINAKMEQKILPHSPQQLELPDDGKRMLGVHPEPGAHPCIAHYTKQRPRWGLDTARGGSITRSPSARCLCRCSTREK